MTPFSEECDAAAKAGEYYDNEKLAFKDGADWTLTTSQVVLDMEKALTAMVSYAKDNNCGLRIADEALDALKKARGEVMSWFKCKKEVREEDKVYVLRQQVILLENQVEYYKRYADNCESELRCAQKVIVQLALKKETP